MFYQNQFRIERVMPIITRLKKITFPVSASDQIWIFFNFRDDLILNSIPENIAKRQN